MEVTTPGRICLFGEHQDYLGLPIIAMAISLRISIVGKKRNDKKVIIHKSDLNETETFLLSDLKYSKPRDYFKSGIKICKKNGLIFSNGFECKIKSQIPISAGTSSSSALNVSWIHFLTKIADEQKDWDQQKIGELAFDAEVTEFNEPGGMMDQYSTAIGNLIYLESEPSISIKKLNPKLGTFILADSGESKNTFEILKRCRDSRQKLFKSLIVNNPLINIKSCDENIDLSDLSDDEVQLYFGTIKNRELLKKALHELQKKIINERLIGELLYEHHTVLRDDLKVSTPKIEKMIDAAMNAGALGAKINGSGGGGCMFAYAPNKTENVLEAINSVNGKAQIIYSDEGSKFLN